jgi:hypothetical protein
MELETQQRPRARHVLLVAAPQDAQANELVNALRASGLNVILANNDLLASQANEVGACVLVLHPEHWNETAAITTALQCNPSYMIPLLVEPMELPEGSWTTEPINLKEPISETAQELAAHITAYFQTLPEEEPVATPSLEEIVAPQSTQETAEEIKITPTPFRSPEPQASGAASLVSGIRDFPTPFHSPEPQARGEASPRPLRGLASGIRDMPMTRPLTTQSGSGPIKIRHTTIFILALAIALTVGLPAFFLSRATPDQTVYKSMKTADSLLTHPYSATVPGSPCDLGGARWAIGQYFKAPSSTSAQGAPTAQPVFDASTEMTCKPDGLLMTKKDHFNYYAIVVFENRDSAALPRHFKTQVSASIVSSSQQASVELGVRMQNPDKTSRYDSGYGNNTFTVREDGKWEARRISNTSSAVAAILSSGSIQPAKTFTLAAEVNGPLMTFSINGRTVSTVSDSTYQNSHGISFGVADPGARAPLSALFSRFTYTPL